jgi:hypothetical protein
MDNAHRKKAAWLTLLPLLLYVFTPVAAVAQVTWAKSFNGALQQAAKEKKYIVLDISASW